MAATDAYQATAPLKAAEISANTEKVKEKSANLHALAKAMAHLRKQTERPSNEDNNG